VRNLIGSPKALWVRRSAAVLLLVVGAGIVIFRSYLISEYVSTRPRQPDQQAGRTHPRYEHGAVIFLTKSEDDDLMWMFGAGLGLMAIGGFLFKDMFGRRR
jgi:hypothetical protein